METTPLSNTTLPLALPQSTGSEISKAGSTFNGILVKTLEQVNQAQLKGDKAIQDLNTGKARNLHEVMIATEEADIAIRMLVQMRNKALDAYNEIMRLQI